jgi:hypothetical protein
MDGAEATITVGDIITIGEIKFSRRPPRLAASFILGQAFLAKASFFSQGFLFKPRLPFLAKASLSPLALFGRGPRVR